MMFIFFFFKQKTAYEMRISDWSSDVCSSDLNYTVPVGDGEIDFNLNYTYSSKSYQEFDEYLFVPELSLVNAQMSWQINDMYKVSLWGRNLTNKFYRSEEHTSELQSLMRISYAVFCLKKKNQKNINYQDSHKERTIKIKITRTHQN